MDPHATLQQIRALYRRILEAADTDPQAISMSDAEGLASYMSDLDEWMSKGGFSPWRWRDEHQKVPNT